MDELDSLVTSEEEDEEDEDDEEEEEEEASALAAEELFNLMDENDNFRENVTVGNEAMHVHEPAVGLPIKKSFRMVIENVGKAICHRENVSRLPRF